MTTKETVREMLDRLPENCSLEDVQYHLSVIQAITAGLADSEAGRTKPHAQIKAEMHHNWLPRVVRATYDKAYRIRVTFSDGVEGTVDFEHWLEGPVFELVKQAAYFRTFFIEGGTITGRTVLTSRQRRCMRQR